MTARIPATLAALLISAPLLAAKPLTIMSWNVENFSDPFDDPYIDGDTENIGASKENAELQIMARAIKEANPDVLACQEIEGDKALKYFLDQYLPGNEYKYYACVPSINWFQNCAIASKVPLGKITSLREIEVHNDVLDKDDNKYNSRLLAVEVKPSPDYTFTLVDLHLKSGGNPEDPAWRKSQIKLLKGMFGDMLKADPKANIMVVGDMNLEPTSEEYGLLTGGLEPVLTDSTAGTGILTHPSTGPRHQYDYVFYDDPMKAEIVPDSVGVSHAVPMNDLARVSDHLPMIVTIDPQDK